VPPDYEVDLSDDQQRQVAARIGSAWRELRRGAAMSALRDRWFATDTVVLEPGQVDTIELLSQRPQWRMSELAEALRVDPSTATRAVQRIVALGLAQRHHCTSDGRVVQVSLTPEGVEWYERVVTERRTTMSFLLRAFSEDERVEFAEYLERFVTVLDAFVDQLDEPT
jgi:DNA-binding MarR family transcriptional regulator